jgi:hypothetical protein
VARAQCPSVHVLQAFGVQQSNTITNFMQVDRNRGLVDANELMIMLTSLFLPAI